MNFPKAIFFIIGNEFCERFSFYGMSGKKYFLIENKNNKELVQ
jgi:dipeptide/tripeptide permease